MAITIEKAGARLYFLGDTFPIKDQIRRLGGHWDGERRAWWVGAKKLPQAQALVDSLVAPALRQAAASVGLQVSTPAGVVADRLDDLERPAEAEAVRAMPPPARPRQHPDDIRLTGKGTYKGKSYYIGATTRDGQRCRLLTLPDARGDYLDFWADVAQVEILKTYQPRQQWDGRRYSHKTRTVYTTLGSIADFLARQRNPETRRGECSECGSWGPSGQPCRDCGGEGVHQ